MPVENRTGQYSIVNQLMPTTYKPSWLPDDEGLRVGSYRLYDVLYWNDVGDFQLTLRGDEDFPIYIPSARRIVKTFCRYAARAAQLNFISDNADQVVVAREAFKKLFARERFWTKFHSEKIRGSIRGDWVFMILADPDKPEGSRISIKTVHPGNYFPLTNPEDDSERWGAQIMEEVQLGDKVYIKVQEWLKVDHPLHPSYGAADGSVVPIQYSQLVYETDNFKDVSQRKVFRVDQPPVLLDGITALPLYHIRTNADPEDKYGVSDLSGIERIFLAINQTATDQDVALAMAGLGMYASDSTPVGPGNEATDWVIGPKRVVEVPPEGKFERVSGVASVEPTIQHMEWIQQQAQSLQGINEIALGNVDVSVAESGIALALRMGPLLDAAEDRDREIFDILNNMLYDLSTMYFPVYERIQFPEVEVVPYFPPKLPEDTAGRLDRLQQLFTDRVMPLSIYWKNLREMGMQLPPDDELRTLLALDSEITDPAGARLEAEATGESGEAVPEEDLIEDGGSE
jgi:hypothetical protein